MFPSSPITLEIERMSQLFSGKFVLLWPASLGMVATRVSRNDDR
jgi:hypothetical protein